jgi:hypothetical protein
MILYIDMHIDYELRGHVWSGMERMMLCRLAWICSHRNPTEGKLCSPSALVLSISWPSTATVTYSPMFLHRWFLLGMDCLVWIGPKVSRRSDYKYQWMSKVISPSADQLIHQTISQNEIKSRVPFPKHYIAGKKWIWSRKTITTRNTWVNTKNLGLMAIIQQSQSSPDRVIASITLESEQQIENGNATKLH